METFGAPIAFNIPTMRVLSNTKIIRQVIKLSVATITMMIKTIKTVRKIKIK